MATLIQLTKMLRDIINCDIVHIDAFKLFPIGCEEFPDKIDFSATSSSSKTISGF